MMFKKVCISFLFILILAECERFPARPNHSRKESRLKSDKNVRIRGEVFENIFSIYDPSFLSTVWPKIKNGVHISLHNNCFQNLTSLYENLVLGSLWAYMVTDSSGRYEPGVFAGRGYWLGAKKQCLDMDKHVVEKNKSLKDNNNVDLDYDWVVVDDDRSKKPQLDETAFPKFRLAYSVAKIYMTIVSHSFTQPFVLTVGLCMPRSCDQDDIASIVSFSVMLNDNLKSNRSSPRLIKMASLREVTDHYDFFHDLGAVILFGFTMVLILIALAATLVDIQLFRCRRISRSITFDIQKYSSTDSANRFIDRKSDECVDANLCNDVPAANNYGNGNNISLVAVKNVNLTPPVTLDVVPTERVSGSCNRCGKYRRQCKSPKQVENLPPCPRVKYSSVASLATQEKGSHLLKRLFLCFSMKYCWMRIFNTNMANKDMSLMHLLKIIATLWVVFIHIAVIVSYATVPSLNINRQVEIYDILATGTLAFDTLFFVSGLFSSHHYFYLRSHYSVEELVSFGGFFGQILQYVCFITNRAIRLLPSYVYVIFLSGVVARMSLETSAVVLPDGDHVNCDRHWWRNIFYITNFYDSSENCMQVSWYLTVESQLHVVGGLLCALGAGRRGRLGAALLFCALLAATAADIAGAHKDYDYGMFGAFTAYSIIITRPWARVVPYFSGVISGWLLHKSEGILNVSKMASGWLWLATVSSLVVSLALPWVGAGWAAGWLHLTWPAALLWPTFLAATRYRATTRSLLNNSMMAALSRLTYSILLLHGPIARFVLLGTDTALCSQTICIWSYFAGTTLLTLPAALLLSLLVEIPFCCVLRRLSDCANK